MIGNSANGASETQFDTALIDYLSGSAEGRLTPPASRHLLRGHG
jgi:hypothetical protein